MTFDVPFDGAVGETGMGSIENASLSVDETVVVGDAVGAVRIGSTLVVGEVEIGSTVPFVEEAGVVSTDVVG